jgi:hypothetical protein
MRLWFWRFWLPKLPSLPKVLLGKCSAGSDEELIDSTTSSAVLGCC